MRLSEKINGGSTSTFLNKLNESEDFNYNAKDAAIDELVKQPNKFKYQMLDRLKSDCEYFLGNGNRNEKDLWADSVEEQIAIMKALWNSLEEKPEWLSMEDIENYEKEMADTTKGPEARKTVEDQLERNYNKVTKTGIEESEDTEYLYTNNIDKYRNKNVIVKADLFLDDIALDDFKEEAAQNNVKILDISEPNENSVMDATFEGNIEDIAHLYGFKSSDEMAKMTDIEVKLADNIKESENLKESTIRKFSTDSEEFKALSAFADELNKRSIESGSSVRYRVDDCYFDFGQNWWWTTVLATNGENGSITGTWQCLSPAQHEKIIQGNSDEVLEQVLASSDKLTK